MRVGGALLGGSLDHSLKTRCASRKISSIACGDVAASARGSPTRLRRPAASWLLQVVEAVVDRRGRQHQHLGLHALADDLAHQPLVAGLLLLGVVVVAEVVRLVDDDQVVVAPVDPVQRAVPNDSPLVRDRSVWESTS